MLPVGGIDYEVPAMERGGHRELVQGHGLQQRVQPGVAANPLKLRRHPSETALSEP